MTGNLEDRAVAARAGATGAGVTHIGVRDGTGTRTARTGGGATGGELRQRCWPGHSESGAGPAVAGLTAHARVAATNARAIEAGLTAHGRVAGAG